MGFPCGSADKESACNVGYLGSIPGLGRSPGEGKGYPLQYSGLENSMGCIIHAVAESDTTEPERLSLSLLRWFSGKEPPCQCRRRGLDPCVRKIPWRRKYQPTPVLLKIPTDGGAWSAAYHLAHTHVGATEHAH